MYAINTSLTRTSGIASSLAVSNRANQEIGFSGFSESLLEKSSTEEKPSSESAAPSSPRTLTTVDLSVQKDIEKEFGIKPYRPGDKLRSLTESSWAFQTDKNGGISLNNLENNAERASNIFQKHFSRFMINNDVSADPAIEFNVAGNGKVQVKGDHPDKEKIESFINDNFELRNLYVGICSAKNLAAIGKESTKFQQKYKVDPKAAVEEFSHLFSGKYSYNTSLTINSNGWDYSTKPFWKI